MPKYWVFPNLYTVEAVGLLCVDPSEIKAFQISKNTKSDLDPVAGGEDKEIFTLESEVIPNPPS